MERRVAVGLTLLAGVLWGTSFIVNDLGLRALAPATFTFWRFALAAVVSLAVALALRSFQPRILLDAQLWLLALVGAVGFLLQYVGQTRTTPARAALFLNSSVLVVALLSWVWLRQPPRRRTLYAMGLGLAGVALLQGRGDLSAYAGGTPLGDALMFLCGCLAAVTFVLFPRVLARFDPWSIMAALFLGIALATAPVAAAAGGLVPARAGWWAIVYSAIPMTSIAYTIWAFTMRRLSPTTSAVLLLLEVLVAAALSLAMGREAFTPVAAVGAALLLAGVVWLGFERAEPA